MIPPKNKIFFKKDKKHLTIDCNNIETIKNNKKEENNYNYNTIINYLFNQTKKENNNNKILFNNTSRNNIYNFNSESNDINNSNKTLFKKSITSFSNSPANKLRKNF